jgi:hypothetical protein
VAVGGPVLDPGAVRFSRHAKNEMRLYKIRPADIFVIPTFPDD